MKSPAKLLDNIRSLLIGVALTANLFVFALVGYSLYESYLQQEQRAATLTQNLATILEQNLSERLRLVDQALLVAREEYVHQMATSGVQAGRMSAFLERLQNRLPELDGLRITDADGVIRYGKGVAGLAPVSLADRDYFLFQRDRADGGAYLGQPVLSRVSGHWIVALAYRINLPDGRFGGIVYATVRVDELTRIFSQLELGKLGSVILRDEGYRLVTRFPPISGPAGVVGTSKVSAEFQDLVSSGETVATYKAPRPSDNIHRIYSFRRLPNWPWYVVAGLARDDYLQDWYGQATRYVGFALLFLLVSLLSLRFIWVGWRRQLSIAEELREIRNTLQTVTDYSTDWVYWRSADRKHFLYISPACERLTGYSAAEFQADPELLDRIIHPEDRVRWANHLVDGCDHLGDEYRILTKSGEERWMGHSCCPVHGAEGEYLGRRGSNVDVTRRKLAEEALVAARDAADAANRAKSQFLAVMSHELRTPMNGILGMAQMLMMPGIDEAERLEFARTVHNSGKTLQALLNDILDHSKIEAGRMELERAAFSPARVLDETVALFGETARAKGLALTLDSSIKADQRFWGDPYRLRQILSNLTNNAIKFTDSGRVHLTVDQVSECLRFAVADTGIGIPEDKQTALFQSFSQVDDSFTRRHGGTGLGLAISRNLARLMGGDMGVMSRPGQGATFWLEIPADPVLAHEESRGRERQVPGNATGRAAQAARLPILLVDDNATNRKVVEAMLGKHGWFVVSAEDGQEALDYLVGQTFGLVLMDCQMPVLDGYEATRRWRAQEGAAQHLPIIALTAAAFEEDRRRCLEAGMDDFLTKPVDIGQLLSCIERWAVAPVLGPSAVRQAEPAALAVVAEQGLFDRAGLLRRFAQDHAMAACAIEVFLEDLPALLAQLQQALQAGDAAQVRLQAHSLKGSSASVAASALADQALQLEEAALQGRLEMVQSALPRLETLAEASCEQLRAFVAEAPALE